MGRIDEKKAAELEQKLRKSLFTLDDYLDQLGQIKNMGNIEQLMGMMPGVKPGALKDAKIDEKQIDRMEAIILSMTKQQFLEVSAKNPVFTPPTLFIAVILPVGIPIVPLSLI